MIQEAITNAALKARYHSLMAGKRHKEAATLMAIEYALTLSCLVALIIGDPIGFRVVAGMFMLAVYFGGKLASRVDRSSNEHRERRNHWTDALNDLKYLETHPNDPWEHRLLSRCSTLEAWFEPINIEVLGQARKELLEEAGVRE